jgi:gluconate 2-dehydrogenase gamma chain
LALEDMRRGFFAERIYLGNRDLLPWRTIGYPEACYDCRDCLSKRARSAPTGRSA